MGRLFSFANGGLREALEGSRIARRRQERGQSLIEFVLIAPLLIFLLLVLVELGSGLNSYLTVVASARDSARLGAQVGVSNTAPLKTIVSDETTRLTNGPVANDNCGSGQGICITSCDEPLNDPPACSGTPVDKWLDVRVCYDHPLIMGIPWLLEGPITMCSHTKIRIVS